MGRPGSAWPLAGMSSDFLNMNMVRSPAIAAIDAAYIGRMAPSRHAGRRSQSGHGGTPCCHGGAAAGFRALFPFRSGNLCCGRSGCRCGGPMTTLKTLAGACLFALLAAAAGPRADPAAALRPADRDRKRAQGHGRGRRRGRQEQLGGGHRHHRQRRQYRDAASARRRAAVLDRNRPGQGEDRADVQAAVQGAGRRHLRRRRRAAVPGAARTSCRWRAACRSCSTARSSAPSASPACCRRRTPRSPAPASTALK